MEHDEVPILEPVLTYRIFLEPDWDVRRALPLLKQLEEEEPELHIIWDETLKELHAQVMGEVQIEVIRQQLFDRYRMHVTFGEGNIVYKETIAARLSVWGILNHYDIMQRFICCWSPVSRNPVWYLTRIAAKIC